jgi:hypothetical protein
MAIFDKRKTVSPGIRGLTFVLGPTPRAPSMISIVLNPISRIVDAIVRRRRRAFTKGDLNRVIRRLEVDMAAKAEEADVFRRLINALGFDPEAVQRELRDTQSAMYWKNHALATLRVDYDFGRVQELGTSATAAEAMRGWLVTLRSKGKSDALTRSTSLLARKQA